MTISHRELYESLASHDVRYLVIGGTAAISHGIPRHTNDVDVLIEATLANAEALVAALREVGLGTAFLVEPAEILEKEVTVFLDVLRLDVLTSAPGIAFAEAWARRMVRDYQGVPVSIAAIDDLIASKEAAGRPQDLADLEYLRRFATGEFPEDDA